MKEQFGSDWENLDEESKAQAQETFNNKLAETGDYNAAVAAVKETGIY